MYKSIRLHRRSEYDQFILMKAIPEDGSFTIMQYSNVMDPICLGVAPDLPSAIYYAITNLGHYIRNWKYKMMEVWA